MKVIIQGENLLFEGFPFKTKEIGISFLTSGVAIFNEPITDLKDWQMNVKIENGICTDLIAKDKMQFYFKNASSKNFIPTPDNSYVCI